jgi:hypothetical protein
MNEEPSTSLIDEVLRLANILKGVVKKVGGEHCLWKIRDGELVVAEPQQVTKPRHLETSWSMLEPAKLDTLYKEEGLSAWRGPLEEDGLKGDTGLHQLEGRIVIRACILVVNSLLHEKGQETLKYLHYLLGISSIESDLIARRNKDGERCRIFIAKDKDNEQWDWNYYMFGKDLSGVVKPEQLYRHMW